LTYISVRILLQSGISINFKTMKSNILKSKKDEQLEAVKIEQQALSRALVRSGLRTQESMFFIPSSIAKMLKIRHRTIEF